MEFRQRGWRHRDRSASRVVRIGVFQKRFGMYLAMAIVLLAGIPRPIEAQVASVVDRIRPLGDGPVYFSYPARDGVRGDGRNLTLDLHDSDHDDGWKSDGFESGPVRARIVIRDREVTDLEVRVGGRWNPSSPERDLGTVPPEEAARFFIGLAMNAKNEDVARDAILPAVIARDVDVWPAVLQIAKDRERPRPVRQSALFWMGQEAGRRMTVELEGFVDDSVEDIELRKHAVFALSQRSDEESTPALLRLARTHPNPEIRASAMFWLSQKDDPRVVELLEEILFGG